MLASTAAPLHTRLLYLYIPTLLEEDPSAGCGCLVSQSVICCKSQVDLGVVRPANGKVEATARLSAGRPGRFLRRRLV